VSDNKQVIRKLYNEGFNTGDVDLMKALVADDFQGSRGEKGPDEFVASIASLRKGFPDVRFTIEDLIAEEDRVAVRWRFEATHSGPFAGTPATGKAVTQTANVIYQLRDGRITRAWQQVDRLGLLQQIGAVAV
jgi:steroid delta-isomerase-like uncharacterized protein